MHLVVVVVVLLLLLRGGRCSATLDTIAVQRSSTRMVLNDMTDAMRRPGQRVDRARNKKKLEFCGRRQSSARKRLVCGRRNKTSVGRLPRAEVVRERDINFCIFLATAR
jgi:hypothetical protein